MEKATCAREAASLALIYKVSSKIPALGWRMERLRAQPTVPALPLTTSKPPSAVTHLQAARLLKSTRAKAMSVFRVGNSSASGGAFFRNATILGMGNLASQIGMLVAAPLLTRIYTPGALGTWAIFTTVTSILGTIWTGKYECAIVLAKGDTFALNVFILGTLFMLANTILLVILFSMIDLFDSHSILGLELSLVTLCLIVLLTISISIGELCRYLALRKERLLAISLFLVTQAWVVAFIQIAIGLGNRGATMALVVGSTLAYLTIACLFATLILLPMRRRLWHCISGRRVLEAAKQYRNFLLYSAPCALLGMAASRVLVILLGVYISPGAAGFVALAARVTSLPNSLISPALNSEFFRWATTHIEQPRVIESLIRSVLHLKIAVGAPVTVFFALNAERLFVFVFGGPWREAGVYAAYLAVSSFFLLLTNWLSHAYSVLHKQKLALIFEATYDLVMLTAVIICLACGLGPRWAVVAFTVVTVLYDIVWLGTTLAILNLRIRLFLECLGLIVVTATAAATLHFLRIDTPNAILYMAACCAVLGASSIHAVARALSLLQSADRPAAEGSK
jgi:lipopolysaccharide exporter